MSTVENIFTEAYSSFKHKRRESLVLIYPAGGRDLDGTRYSGRLSPNEVDWTVSFEWRFEFELL